MLTLLSKKKKVTIKIGRACDVWLRINLIILKNVTSALLFTEKMIFGEKSGH